MKTTDLIIVGTGLAALMALLLSKRAVEPVEHFEPESQLRLPQGAMPGAGKERPEYQNEVQILGQTPADSEPTTVTTTFNPNGEREKQMIQEMEAALADDGRQVDPSIVRDLLLARQEYDWSHYPASWSSPDAIAPAAARLKTRIAYALASTNYAVMITNEIGQVGPQVTPADALTIQRVLEAGADTNSATGAKFIPFQTPPMVDYTLREGPEGVNEELAAIRRSQQ